MKEGNRPRNMRSTKDGSLCTGHVPAASQSLLCSNAHPTPSKAPFEGFPGEIGAAGTQASGAARRCSPNLVLPAPCSAQLGQSGTDREFSRETISHLRFPSGVECFPWVSCSIFFSSFCELEIHSSQWRVAVGMGIYSFQYCLWHILNYLFFG